MDHPVVSPLELHPSHLLVQVEQEQECLARQHVLLVGEERYGGPHVLHKVLLLPFLNRAVHLD